VAPQYSLSALPPDASYEAAIAALQRQRDDQITQLAQARTQNLLDYGFKEGPNGMLTFDPNNPLSKAAQLKKAYDTNRRSTANQLAAGGQLYSGARQNALDLVSRNQLGAEDQMQKSLASFLARNTQSRTGALTGYETAAGQVYGDRVGRFQSNPLYDPATGALMPAEAATGPSTAAPAPPATQAPTGFHRLPTGRVPAGALYTRPRTPARPRRPSVRRPRAR
jgi:hypothetical protein